MTNPTVKHRPKAEWPSAEANKVLGDAILIGHDKAINTVEIIRDQLFGNADKMEDLATIWGHDKTMTTSRDEIDVALENVDAYWQGGGFEAFSRYSLSTSTKFTTNESKMNDIAEVLGECVKIVYNTYSYAIELIGDCANALHELSPADFIPGAGQALKIWNALNDFVKAWNDLYAKSVREMGNLITGKLKLSQLANDFEDLRAPGDGAGDPDRWKVTPK
jgi:hypothetical protein